MSIPVSAIVSQALAPVAGVQSGLAGASGDGRGEFKNLLESAMQRVEEFRRTADQGVEKFLSGEAEEVHQVVLDTQRAELALEMFVQVRNKVVQAYQEIMRMQM